ncbi:multidrug effflux MFS transporter [Aliikangiella marina]|uniref:Multidrug effflux MFS transporter n=1 Tax=Aliikangiella marina TaxID=1712262 RepID=A0A545TA31_9GAMM|nr:MFS transporter [Aliikangiella marina]TQV74065.1 multidrug effflux MFS transporter [Aliikangiella marina]
MSLTFIISFVLLILMAALGRHFIQLPKNIWLLFLAQPLGMASSSMVVFAGGLLATKIAPRPELATLPLTLMILGTALAVIPASLAMKKFGRKNGTILGLLIAVIGALVAMQAALNSAFSLLIVGSILLGASLAFVAQMRFAAIESVEHSLDAPKAISVLMVGGIFAAILGPEVAVSGQNWFDSPYGYAGSFLGLAGLLLLAIIVISWIDPINPPQQHESEGARPLIKIIQQPIFIIAVLAGAIGYSVMSYVMTATPLSMHEVEGHSLHSTKWVVQSHIIAMYLPSLFSAILIRYIGIARLMILGCVTYIGVVFIALSGQHVMHYWWALILLGIGWNFLFTSGTLLLPESYQGNERFKAQAVNDFSIFIVQALGSLSAGIILFSQGWNQLIYISIPVILIMFGISIWYFVLSRKELVTKEV